MQVFRKSLSLSRSAALKSQAIAARGFSSSIGDNESFVVGLARTPVGKLGGALSSLTAPQLGAHVISSALERSGMDTGLVEEAFMGNVVSANIGQAPTRQAVIGGYRNACVAGGMESMSNIPYYLPGARTGYRLGNNKVVDGLVNDGLWDIYNNQHMGMCGESCATDFNITREDQDAYAIQSYQRAAAAWEAGKFTDEVAPVTIKGKRGKPDTVISVDEEFTNIKMDKITSIPTAFKKDGTITAANASTINDGATAMVVVSGKMVKDLNLTPLFKIRGYGDAARDPVEFTIAPSDAVPRALAMAGVSAKDIEYHEINEAFSVVAMANVRLMDLDMARVNVNGGAVALGHPIGSSGARIIGTLYNVLKQNNATLGCASICNGGGGASAIVIERMS
eukprot:GSChrysophyteH2.ASY1.ANO1.1687.1 assembled CDS